VSGGETENRVERHRFNKSLKKAGIKKSFAIDQNWESNSTVSEISDISIGNASYILDLAQQKETRKKDREEEALEEALELYGTWLTEGKNDDKNIFLMILHEVKKEQKGKYRKADKKHASLLDAALDEELKRREKIKQEESEKEHRPKIATTEAEKRDIETLPCTNVGISASDREHKRQRGKSCGSKRHLNYSKQSESKISEIISSQRNLKPVEKVNSEEENGDHRNGTAEFSEPSIRILPKNPKSNTIRSRKSRIFSWSRLPKSDPEMYGKTRTVAKEDSKSMFSRLRRQLSERKCEQLKAEESAWNKNDHVETKEEQWWKKINQAKQENVLFDQSNTSLNWTMSANQSAERSSEEQDTIEQSDSSTRSSPVEILDNCTSNLVSEKVNTSQIKLNDTFPILSANTSSGAQADEGKDERKKNMVWNRKTKTKLSSDASNEKKKSAKKVVACSDAVLVLSDNADTRSKYREKKKKKKSSTAGDDGAEKISTKKRRGKSTKKGSH